MLRDVAVGWVQFNLGKRTDLFEEAVNALASAQEELERADFLPWFLRTERSAESSAPAEERVLLPPDFIREWEDCGLYRLVDDPDEDRLPLRKDTIEQLRKYWRGRAAGAPTAYAIDSEYFRLFPTPDAVYQLQMIYYAKDEVAYTNIENRWLKNAPWLVISEATRMLAVGLRDTAAEKAAMQRAMQARGDMMRASEARDFENRRLIMGGAI